MKEQGQGEYAVRTRVLVVEDNLMQRDILAGVLRAKDFDVVTAQDGLDAVSKVHSGEFDIVLMDYRLPELDGLAAARLIADFTRRTGRPRLIALSADIQHLSGREAGARSVFDAVIAKPWNPPALCDLVRQVHEAAGQPPAASADPPGAASPGKAFLFGFPAAQDGTRAQHAQGASPQLRILIADDDEVVRAALQTALRTAGYEVDAAPDGLEAMRALSERHYDLVLLDYQMPEIDGLAAGRLIVELMAHADRPRLIAVTSTPEQLQVQEFGSWSVFDGVISKSFGLPALLSVTRNYVGAAARQEPGTPHVTSGDPPPLARDAAIYPVPTGDMPEPAPRDISERAPHDISERAPRDIAELRRPLTLGA